MPIDVREPEQRFVTQADGRTTYHSFSFGLHYDPHNIGFGALVAHNDELLPPGTGYGDHPHRDTEIVTWVLSGALRHRDSAGNETVLEPGQVQRISAGSGVVHAETSASRQPTRFLQAWVRPDEPDLEPSYLVERVGTSTGLVPVASGDGDAVVPIAARGTALHVGVLPPGHEVVLPDAPRLHVFVAEGSGALAGSGRDPARPSRLSAGAAARLVDAGAATLVAGPDGASVMVWSLP
jgi:quercetin 2,3-dioxygenase